VRAHVLGQAAGRREGLAARRALARAVAAVRVNVLGQGGVFINCYPCGGCSQETFIDTGFVRC